MAKPLNAHMKPMARHRDPVQGFTPIKPSSHQKASSGIPDGFRNNRKPNAKPGKLPGAPKLPGC